MEQEIMRARGHLSCCRTQPRCSEKTSRLYAEIAREPLDHVSTRPDLSEILEQRYGRAQLFSPDKACSDCAKRSDL
jgi:hypothetical protein